MRRSIQTILFLALAPFAAAGFRPSPGWPAITTPFYHAGSEADFRARMKSWAQSPGVFIGGYQDTESMRPVLRGGKEKLVLRAVTRDTKLAPGQIVQATPPWRSARGEGAVIHYIAAVSRDGMHVMLSGTNCRRDGWTPRSQIHAMVLEVIVPPHR
jgi:hypothetical protein